MEQNSITRRTEFELTGQRVMPESDVMALSAWLNRRGFFDAPASTKYHGAYPGGLYDHSMEMYRQLWWMTGVNDLQWQEKRSPFVVALLHDVCKMDQYKPNG